MDDYFQKPKGGILKVGDLLTHQYDKLNFITFKILEIEDRVSQFKKDYKIKSFYYEIIDNSNIEKKARGIYRVGSRSYFDELSIMGKNCRIITRKKIIG